jgi:NADH-quinone oxidoreductase subunit J
MELSKGLQFILLAAQLMTVVSAILVTFHPNILYASISLLFTFLGVAGLFVFAGADFLAAVQIVVYVGGVTILVLFAIMLTQWLYGWKLMDAGVKLIAPVTVGCLLLYFLFPRLTSFADWILHSQPEKFDQFSVAPKTALMGQALLGTYLLPFEGITILLLGALVGAVWLARPR